MDLFSSLGELLSSRIPLSANTGVLLSDTVLPLCSTGVSASLAVLISPSLTSAMTFSASDKASHRFLIVLTPSQGHQQLPLLVTRSHGFSQRHSL